jgi:ABC-type nitrate/sulfonate/bicarbonate transport system substrate-binding protein
VLDAAKKIAPFGHLLFLKSMAHALRIGFIPLLDGAPLVIAHEKGFFEKQGLAVELLKAQSWDQVLARLVEGEVEAAHMLVTVPLQWVLTPRGKADPLVYAVSLSHHGNAITISNALWRGGVRDAVTLKEYARTLADRPLQLAVVHPRSTHEYLLRLWLEAGDLKVGEGIVLRYVAPPVMVSQLREGGIDAFCVGEPWNQRAVSSKLGYIAVTGSDLLPPMNEKVLAVRAAWHREHPEQHAAMVRAVAEASDWLGNPANLDEAVERISGKRYVNTPPDPVRAAMRGVLQGGGHRTLTPRGFLRFAGEGTNFPDPNHARFYLERMWRAGHVSAEQAEEIDLRSICLDRFYEDTLQAAGLATPDRFPTPRVESYASFLQRFPTR